MFATRAMISFLRHISCAGIVLLAQVSFAQVVPLRLTLSECIRLARENGPLGVIARATFENKQAAYNAFEAGNYPQLSLQGDVPGYFRSINPIVLPDGTTIFSPQSQASSSLNLGLTQKIPFTVGQMSLATGVNRIDLLDSKTQY
jgi:outer membrane protein